jgi:dynein heavy chain 1
MSWHGTLSDMKTEALKDSHWKTILEKINIHVPYIELTLGMLWGNGLLNRKKDMAETYPLLKVKWPLKSFSPKCVTDGLSRSLTLYCIRIE